MHYLNSLRPPPRLIKLFHLTFFDKSGNRMTNVNLTNTRINILDSEDGYMIYLIVEGYGVFIIKYSTEAHLVIDEPNVYAMQIRRVQKSNIPSGLVYLVAWKEPINDTSGKMQATLYDDSFNMISLDGGIQSDIEYDVGCTWDRYRQTQRFTGDLSALTVDNGRGCIRSSFDFILPVTATNVCNIYMDYVASILDGKTCSLLDTQSAPAFTLMRSGTWTPITTLNNNADLKISQLVSNTTMTAVVAGDDTEMTYVLSQHVYETNRRGFLIPSIYVNGVISTSYSYIEYRSVSTLRWFFMMNIVDRKIDLGGTNDTYTIEILTSDSIVRPTFDEFLYVYNPDEHITTENIISDTYYLINNGGIYLYRCMYDRQSETLSCTVNVVLSFTQPYDFSFVFPTNGNREAIIVDKNNTTYLFNPATNEFIIGDKIDLSLVTSSTNGIIVTKDNMVYSAIPIVNALY